MKFKLFLFFSLWVLIFTVSCNKDEITFDDPSQELLFSRDTVFCDTVYHQVRSETYVVKVFNTEDKDIMIPRIHLEKGASSLFKINVDGKSGYDFKNVPLRKKDSLYVFVEIAPEADGPEAIAEDRILFTTNAGQQHVTLFSVVQDAEFFIQSSTNPNIITNHTTWTNDKAKIIYGDLTINPNVTLDVEAGTKIYFHKDSGMKVLNAARLNLNGTQNQQIVIRGDRNDTYYDTIPKNWNSIKMEEASILNMNHTRLFGGKSGLEMKKATANINNSFIHTFENYGINAIESIVSASNLVMNNCGESAIGIFKGGNHKYVHSTIINYSDLMHSRNRNGIFATNEWKNENGQIETAALQQLSVFNSIVYTDRDNAIYLEPTTGQQFEYFFRNSLIKYSTPSEANYNFDNNINVVQSIKNEDPKFVNYFVAQMNLRVKADSPAKAKGDASIAATVPLDIVNNSRTSNPTLGAYQLQ